MKGGVVYFLFIVFLLFGGIIGFLISNESEEPITEYQYINTESNRHSGLTTYTLIYLHNGEVKYLNFDDPATKMQFMKITGMGAAE